MFSLTLIIVLTVTSIIHCELPDSMNKSDSKDDQIAKVKFFLKFLARVAGMNVN